jgi:hypothetical protein
VVCRWQMVTVALARVSRCAVGMPTTVDRPTTVTFVPARVMWWCSSRAITAWAVAGAKAVMLATSRPRLAGLAPSMSLAGSMASRRVSGSVWAGRGFAG